MARPVVKSVAAVVEKWKRRASNAGEEYRLGVSMTTADWAASTKAAEGAWRQGVADAQARGAFMKGVDMAGTDKWKRNAEKLGPGRFAEGVQNAEPAFNTGIGPVLAAIGGVDLPPRGAVGSDSNLARVGAITKALRMLRTGRR